MACMTNRENFSNNTESNASGNDVTDHVIATAENVVITCLALVIIIGTVSGNIMVVIAVLTERRLRKVGNSFIVSLAVSDLLVGLVVTPFAIAYQLMGTWQLGSSLCDMWVSLDVISCTASIMNLCVISFDRYNAITQPLQYARKRTARRAAIMILVAWLYSVIIALPPLLGWREQRNPDYYECMISQDKGYTIYSTVGAFYLPLFVMIYLYGRVFRATLKRKREWVPGPGSSQVSVRIHKVKVEETSVMLSNADTLHEPRRRHSHRSSLSLSRTLSQSPKDKSVERQLRKYSNCTHLGYRLMQNGDTVREAPETAEEPRTAIAYSAPIDDGNHGSDDSKEADIPLHTFKVGNTSSDEDAKCPEQPRIIINGEANKNNNLTDLNEDSPEVVKLRKAAIAIRSYSNSFPRRQSSLLGSFRWRRNKDDDGDGSLSNESCDNEPTFLKLKVRRLVPKRKKRISVPQEKRAAKTLGIIMGCFIVCWLPFFVIAVLLPFCPSCNVPQPLHNSFTWLGYCNSALNPIIYTFFNQDFRNAFRKLIFWRRCACWEDCPKIGCCRNCYSYPSCTTVRSL
ncbi:5-hydroxytryptamine receptor 1A-like [Lineus longissimus]|uniref:5-hydroxytryptamine receptor 1A-like n=1 Tax=Lineus longissimus TaxID=88925 RepID=UPI00315DB200